ncbi:hypothetical protein Tco_1137323 [Tanacetum coccineum]
MGTMAENVIAAGYKNRPPTLEKVMYDSWKTRIILYIRGKENGKMLKDSIDNGPFKLKPVITVKDTDGTTDITRPQTVEDLTPQEKLRYDDDIKAVNILLRLPVDIYTLINHFQIAKEIWDRVKELMDGTKMTKFVTAAKQERNLHKVNFDQLYACLKHNKRDAKEVREMRQRFSDPLALIANTYNLPPSYITQQIQYHSQPFEVYQHYQSNTPITQQLIQSPPLQSYAPPVFPQQPPMLPTQPDSGFVVPTCLPTYDPITSFNKAMIFLSSAYSSRFPPTNNQLRTLSNPRTQATIQNGQVMVQNVQGRQSQGYAGSAGKNQATGARCTAKKGVKDSEWFKDKFLLAQAQEVGVVLNDEQQDFLDDSLEETDDCEDFQLQATTNFKTDHVDAYDSDCDDKATVNAIFMASLYPVGFINDETVKPRYDLTYSLSNGNVISYADYMVTIRNDADNYVPPSVQNNDMILSVIEQMKYQVEKCNTVTQATQSVNESLTSELERYKERVKTFRK